MNADQRRSIRCTLLLSALVCVHPRFQPSAFAEVSFEKRWLSGMFYGEGANFGDFNNDGKLDVVSGPYVYEGPEFTVKREFMPREASDPLHYSKNFFAYSHDFNRDGWQDILIIGFPGAETYWYENPGKAENTGHWKRHLALKVTDNESPTFANLVGDEAPELVCMSGGHAGYAAPDPADPTRPWTFHKITPKLDFQRFTHGLGVGDINGDGRPDLLEKTGWWEQPASLASEWTKHDFPFSGPGGAQMHAYDVDGDGDNDLITSLQAHSYGLAWCEQIKKPDGTIDFRRHLILSENPDEKLDGVQFSQLHAVELVDIDGDGLKDILTGKRHWAHGPGGDPDPEGDPVLYWFKLTRDSRDNGQVRFEPHLIDRHSGVGTQVSTADANADGTPDIVVGNKRGTMLFLSKSTDRR